MSYLAGLGQEECRKNASSVLFTSVKSAHACVAALHQKEIHGRSVWARRLGGEVMTILMFCYSFIVPVRFNFGDGQTYYYKYYKILSYFFLLLKSLL